MAANLTADQIADWRKEFQSNPKSRLTQNAVAQVSVDEVALDRSVVTSIDHTFSHKLDEWGATNQKQSGRCWMFAGLNLFRVGAMKKMNLKEFEFSQNYTMFWDKLERANYFLEAIIETADSEPGDRVVMHLLDRPIDDGGQWNMFVSVVKKHGVVPKSAMPETESSSSTGRMNRALVVSLRQTAMKIHAAKSGGASADALRAIKEEGLGVVYRILSIHLGTPPEKFDWQWNDKDNKFSRDGEMTPQEFAEKYITIPYEDYVCLVHDPRKTSPMGRTFTVQHLGNVVGGNPVVYLNIELDMMKKIAADSIVNGEPVWFGCDVGPQLQNDMGIWDAKLFDYDNVYDTEFALTKADRLVYRQTFMTHAMLFTGVDLVDNKARRWRVENSWGDEKGKKGFYLMNDSWFDEYMFEIAAPKSALPEELQKALAEPPIVLPPWDPMGALAR